MNLVRIVKVDVGEVIGNFLAQIIVVKKIEIGMRGNGESVGNREPGMEHFAQIGSFATNQSDIVLINLIKPDNVFIRHSFSIWINGE